MTGPVHGTPTRATCRALAWQHQEHARARVCTYVLKVRPRAEQPAVVEGHRRTRKEDNSTTRSVVPVHFKCVCVCAPPSSCSTCVYIPSTVRSFGSLPQMYSYVSLKHRPRVVTL